MNTGTLLSASKAFSGMELYQLEPRVLHNILVGELSRTLAQGLKEKIGALYTVGEAGLNRLRMAYPAYSLSGYHGDSVTYGVEFHIMSREELKAHVDKATAELRKQHTSDLVEAMKNYDASVVAEAKRLLEKAAQ